MKGRAGNTSRLKKWSIIKNALHGAVMMDEYRSAFLEILNNAPDPGSKAGQKPRDRGFVVEVEGKRSLEPLQDLCFDSEQTYNSCYTARYRIGSGAVFGTLLVALIKDLHKIASGEQPSGIYRPEPAERELESLREFIARQPIIADLSEGRIDEIPLELIERMLVELDSWTQSAVGKRFVLFCEVEGPDGDTEDEESGHKEWELARSTILTRLPERVGLVLSGIPENIELAADDTQA
jgi:hypothetical protein